MFRRKKKTLLPPKKMFTDVPAGLRVFLLNDLALKLASQMKGNPQAYSKEADRIFDKLYKRNARGIALERAGQIDKAIVLYEANIADMFGGNHPYDRLRIIYSKRKQYDQALRVCQQFIQMADTLKKLGSPRSDLPAKRQRFVEWCKKLEIKLQKQANQ